MFVTVMSKVSHQRRVPPAPPLLSHLTTGLCAGSSGKQASPSDDPASGSVCDGWNTPVVDLIALGLLKDVLLRLDALPSADRTVYVTGHSRGGALVSQAHLSSADSSAFALSEI